MAALSPRRWTCLRATPKKYGQRFVRERHHSTAFLGISKGTFQRFIWYSSLVSIIDLYHMKSFHLLADVGMFVRAAKACRESSVFAVCADGRALRSASSCLSSNFGTREDGSILQSGLVVAMRWGSGPRIWLRLKQDQCLPSKRGGGARWKVGGKPSARFRWRDSLSVLATLALGH